MTRRRLFFRRVGKIHIIALLLALAGLVIAGAGLWRGAELSSAVPLTELRLDGLRQGRCVTGTVSAVLCARSETGPGAGGEYPVAIEDAVTGTRYLTVAMGGGEYITLIVPRSLTRDFERLDEEPFHLTGRVTRGLKYGLNYEGLRRALALESDEAVRARVSPDCGIEITDPAAPRRLLCSGLALTAAAALLPLWRRAGGRAK